MASAPGGSRGTGIKNALAEWEKHHNQKCSKATVVKLLAQNPPIEKMDVSLNRLEMCEQLSLSTNCISKIANLGGLRNLRILSLGRNNITVLTGLEPVSATLEELWVSYNQIEKLKGINVLRNLRVLYMSNNQVKDWNEFGKLVDLKSLRDLVFVGNPLEEAMSFEGTWRESVTRKLPLLEKLDGVPIIRPDESADASLPVTPYHHPRTPRTPKTPHKAQQQDGDQLATGKKTIVHFEYGGQRESQRLVVNATSAEHPLSPKV